MINQFWIKMRKSDFCNHQLKNKKNDIVSYLIGNQINYIFLNCFQHSMIKFFSSHLIKDVNIKNSGKSILA